MKMKNFVFSILPAGSGERARAIKELVLCWLAYDHQPNLGAANITVALCMPSEDLFSIFKSLPPTCRHAMIVTSS